MTENNEVEVTARKNKFQNIIDQFNGDIEYDPEFIQSAVEDVRVRDAIFHYATNKYQIGLYGELECTVEDCSDIRKGLAVLLTSVCNDVGATGALTTIMAGIALLDGALEATQWILEQTLEHDPTNLARLMYKSLAIEDVVSVWTGSVEETSIEDALIGA
jgi:hypothetical protein